MALEGWSHQTTRMIQDGNWRSGVEGLIAVQIPAGKSIKKGIFTNAEGGMAARTRVRSENSGSNCSLSSTITASDPSTPLLS